MPGSNQFLRALSSDVLDLLEPRMRMGQFPAGKTLFTAGERITKVYCMTSGAVSLISQLADGQMIESAMLGRDSIVGGGAALDDRDAVYTALVQVPGEGYAVDADYAHELARESEVFRTAISRHEQLILAQAHQSAACNAAHSLEQRLARWLLRARDVTGNDSFDLTQEFVAEMLGVQRTSVTIVSKMLQQAGLIKRRRGRVVMRRYFTSGRMT